MEKKRHLEDAFLRVVLLDDLAVEIGLDVEVVRIEAGDHIGAEGPEGVVSLGDVDEEMVAEDERSFGDVVAARDTQYVVQGLRLRERSSSRL